jgi:hypothetical protein
MNRVKRLALISALLMAYAGVASATTYYIAANGSDTNNGTTKTTPWQHAPGMKSCTNACAAGSPKPGDQFIFRGGDTWHVGNSSASPYVGSTGWNWTWNGNSSNQIYIGVDQTWSAGSSWARPILSGDNPMSTSFVSGCAHDFSGWAQLVNLNASYLTFDNFEMSGVCWSAQVVENGMVSQPGGSVTNSIISNFYCHGWTMTSGASDNFPCILTLGGGNLTDYNQYADDVFDGSDSPHFPVGDTVHCQWSAASTGGCASGQGIYGRAYDVHGSVFRYLSNFMVTTNTHTIHDNLFEYLYSTFASGSMQQHPNVLNNLGGATGDPLYFYDNIMRHTFVTENVYLAVRTNVYIFNNVFYDNMNSIFGVLPGGCIRLNSVSNSAATQTAYIYNNTQGDSSCQIRFEVANSPLTPWNGTGNFQNNHFIGFSPGSLSSIYICATGGQCSINDNGNEIYQTTGVANQQGYVASNNYAPTTGGATIGAGANLSSQCGTFSPDGEFCQGTSDGASEQSGSGGQIAIDPAISMVARQSSWDVGAYEFGGSGGTPTPPTGLTAAVQ